MHALTYLTMLSYTRPICQALLFQLFQVGVFRLSGRKQREIRVGVFP